MMRNAVSFNYISKIVSMIKIECVRLCLYLNLDYRFETKE
jgi:hypothetical protein